MRLVAAVMIALVLTGCASKRTIDVEKSGSVPVKGTSWMRFCDGPNAVIWIPSVTDSDPDELEAYVYDHPECGGAGGQNPRDTDGISEDSDE